jgi:hypothetical protein
MQNKKQKYIQSDPVLASSVHSVNHLPAGPQKRKGQLIQQLYQLRLLNEAIQKQG